MSEIARSEQASRLCDARAARCWIACSQETLLFLEARIIEDSRCSLLVIETRPTLSKMEVQRIDQNKNEHKSEKDDCSSTVMLNRSSTFFIGCDRMSLSLSLMLLPRSLNNQLWWLWSWRYSGRLPRDLSNREIDNLSITSRMLGLKLLQSALNELSSKGRRKKFTAEQLTARVSSIKTPSERVSLKNADLSGEWLSGLFLQGAKLSGSLLDNTNLSGSNLDRADMVGIQAIEADFDQATMNESNLRSSIMRGSSMQGARLSKSDLSGCDMSHVSAREADFSGASMVEVDLSQSDIDRSTMVGIDA